MADKPGWPIDNKRNGPFVGRRLLLAELRGALFDPGARRHISIYGMPRVGKSWLLDEIVKELPGGNKVIPIFCPLPETLSGALRGYFLDLFAWNGCELYDEVEPILSTADELGKGAPSLELLALFRELLRKTTQAGYRVLLLVDEFDLIMGDRDSNTPPWSEEEYLGFVNLLMDPELNVVCVTASRRKIEGLIAHNQYRWRINPFENRLLTGFDEEDMEECLQRLEVAGCLITSDEALDKLMYRCGRNPHLLNRIVLTPYVKAGGAATLEEICTREETKKDFARHFREVLHFMFQEERLRQHSFSHIVKCYFDPSPDYRDIQDRFIDMGYLELRNPQSRFTWSGSRDKFVYQDTDLQYEDAEFVDKLPPGERQYVYLTLSPYFVDQFYTAQMSTEDGLGTVLEQVKDTKDLLTSVVHTLRDITDEEMRRASCGDCKYKAHCPQAGIGEMAGIFGAAWNAKLLCNCVRARDKGAVLFQGPEPDGTYEMRGMGRGDVRKINISSPAKYLLLAFNRSGGERSPVPLLDPINLSSNGEILLTFLPIFQNFFGCFQASGGAWTGKLMKALKHLESARNEIAHYSRVGMTAVMAEDTAALCRYLLRSIYLWRREGVVAPATDPPEWRTPDARGTGRK